MFSILIFFSFDLISAEMLGAQNENDSTQKICNNNNNNAFLPCFSHAFEALLTHLQRSELHHKLRSFFSWKFALFFFLRVLQKAHQ